VTKSAEVEPPQPQRSVWSVDPALLSDRDSVSATELEDRLACPLKWVLRHRANLRPSSIAQLPDDYRLKGTFCHKILEYAFNDGGELPPVEEAVAKVKDYLMSGLNWMPRRWLNLTSTVSGSHSEGNWLMRHES